MQGACDEAPAEGAVPPDELAASAGETAPRHTINKVVIAMPPWSYVSLHP